MLLGAASLTRFGNCNATSTFALSLLNSYDKFYKIKYREIIERHQVEARDCLGYVLESHLAINFFKLLSLSEVARCAVAFEVRGSKLSTSDSLESSSSALLSQITHR